MDSAIRVNFYRPNYKSDQVSDQVDNHNVDLIAAILDYCKKPKSLKEIMEKIEFKQRINFKNKYINPLLDIVYL